MQSLNTSPWQSPRKSPRRAMERRRSCDSSSTGQSSGTMSTLTFTSLYQRTRYSPEFMGRVLSALKIRELQQGYMPRACSSPIVNQHEQTLDASKTAVELKVTQLLDELTEDNFDRVSAQVLGWANISVDETDARTLRQVCELIVQRGTHEKKGSRLHALLCRHVALNVSDEVSPKSADGKASSGGLLFRKYLLSECQTRFEHFWPEDEQVRQVEHDVFSAATTCDPPGLVRFISRLYNVSVRFDVMLLNDRIIHRCITAMLRHCNNKPEESTIQCVCTLLLTTAAKLDEGTSRKDVHEHVERMKALTSHPQVTQRMRNMLQYIIDLRANHWAPTATPKRSGITHPLSSTPVKHSPHPYRSSNA